MPPYLFAVVLSQLVAVLGLAGGLLATAPAPSLGKSIDGSGQTHAVTAPAAVDAPEETGAPPPQASAAPPTGVTVPSAGIDSPMIPLGKADDGSLEVPSDPHTAGWWTGGARPGEPGASVIVGHVDSWEGPGAFFGLRAVEPGERVTVARDDGTSVDFRVQRVEEHSKDAFPTDEVYGHTDEATLRLITCAGHFDPRTRSYDDNVIVFLELDESELRDQQVATRDPTGHSGVETAGVETSAMAPDTAGEPDLGVAIAAAMLSLLGAGGGLVGQRLEAR